MSKEKIYLPRQFLLTYMNRFMKSIHIDNGIDIYFKHKANKEISKLTMKEVSVIEAIQTISPGDMNDQIRKKLSNTLSEPEIQHLLKHGKSMRKWIYEELKVSVK